MSELDLDAIKARAAIRPGALLAALRCVPDGEIRHGCVISDGQRTKDAIRTAYHVVHKDTPALIAEVERLREHVRILECAVDGCRISCAQWERVAQDAMLRDGLTTAEVMRIERERGEAIAERDRYAGVVAAAQAWREMRRATPAKPKPAAAALIAAVDRLGGDDDG